MKLVTCFLLGGFLLGGTLVAYHYAVVNPLVERRCRETASSVSQDAAVHFQRVEQSIAALERATTERFTQFEGRQTQCAERLQGVEARCAELDGHLADLSAQSRDLSRTTRQEVRIEANKHWQTVLPLVEPGDEIEMWASGTWKYGDRYEAVGPEGATGGPAGYQIFPTHPIGALLCGIDQGKTFNVVVSSHVRFTVPAGVSGSLDFAINDTDVGNNSGSLAVTVVRKRRTP